MLYEETHKEILRATLELYRSGLIHLTSGNISARASSEHVAIRPSRVPYESM